MAEAFEPITTQEAFDAAVADRLAPYADYDDLKAQNASECPYPDLRDGRPQVPHRP